MRWFLYVAACSLLAPLAGCAQDVGWATVERSIEQNFPDVPQVTPDSLAVWLASEQPPVLLDVRTAEEYAVSHLPGARHHLPDAGADALGDLPRDTPIVAYCSVGYRSSEMAEQLRAAGFTRVVNLRGSIFQWANEGRPVIRGGEQVEQVHPYNRLWGRLLDPELRAYDPSD